MPFRGRATNPSCSVSYSTASASIATRISQPYPCLAPGLLYARYWQFEPCDHMQIVYSTSLWLSPQTGRFTSDAIQVSSRTREKSEMTILKKLLEMQSSWLSLAKPNVSSRVHRVRKSLMPFGGMLLNQERRTSPTCITVENAFIKHEAITL